MDTNKLKTLLSEVKSGTKSEDEASKEIMADYGKAIKDEQAKIQDVQNELGSVKANLVDANKEIKSYKDMDIDSIKNSASEWETKYNDLVKAQDEAKKESIKKERVDAFFSDVKFASESAKAGVIAQFNEKDFKYDEDSKKFLGASEWLEDLKNKDSGAFLSDVANPTFTTNPTDPTVDSSLDEIKEIMGLSETKK